MVTKGVKQRNKRVGYDYVVRLHVLVGLVGGFLIARKAHLLWGPLLGCPPGLLVGLLESCMSGGWYAGPQQAHVGLLLPS